MYIYKLCALLYAAYCQNVKQFIVYILNFYSFLFFLLQRLSFLDLRTFFIFLPYFVGFISERGNILCFLNFFFVFHLFAAFSRYLIFEYLFLFKVSVLA